MSSKQFGIFDWAGNRILPDVNFTNFDEAADCICESFGDEDDNLQEYYVRELND